MSAAGNGPLGGRQTLYSIATQWHRFCRGQKDATAFLLRDPQHSTPYSLQSGRSGDRIPVGTKFSAPVQTGSDAHRASYTVVTGSLSRVKRPGCGVVHPPYLASRLKKEYSYTSTPPLGLRGLFLGEIYLTMYQATVSHSKFSVLDAPSIRNNFIFHATTAPVGARASTLLRLRNHTQTQHTR